MGKQLGRGESLVNEELDIMEKALANQNLAVQALMREHGIVAVEGISK